MTTRLITGVFLVSLIGCGSGSEITEDVAGTQTNGQASPAPEVSKDTDAPAVDPFAATPNDTFSPSNSLPANPREQPSNTPNEQPLVPPNQPVLKQPAPAQPQPKPFKPWTHQLTGKPEDKEDPYAYDVDVSRDGERVVVACLRRGRFQDGFASLLDADTGKRILDLWGHTYGVSSVSFSADGKRVYSGGWDHTFRQFDATTGKELSNKKEHDWPLLTLDISPGGKQAVTASDGVKLWDLESGEVLRSYEKLHKTNPVWCVKWMPDGKRVIGGSGDGQLGLWNLETDDPPRIVAKNIGRLKCVDISPDGKFAVTAASNGPNVTLFDIEAGTKLRQWQAHEAGVSTAIFSPDGKHILTAGGALKPGTGVYDPDSPDRSIRLWDAQTGTEVKHIGDHELYVTSLVFSPDGKRIYSTSGDSTVRAWQLD